MTTVIPRTLDEVRNTQLPLLERTERAVRSRLTREITYWDHRAAELGDDEARGKINARLNAEEARRRADDLTERLKRRVAELEAKRDIIAVPPAIVGAVLVVPGEMLRQESLEQDCVEQDAENQEGSSLVGQQGVVDRMAIAARARQIVIERERRLGYEVRDVELERLGYDIESRDPISGAIRFIEVKGRTARADVITVTRNEILFSLNNPERYILAIIAFGDDGSFQETYLKRPFQTAPDFGAQSVNYSLDELRAYGETDRG